MTHPRALGVLAGLLTLVALAAVSIGPAAEPAETEERLLALEDHVRIEQLLMRYAAALNTGDADTYVALFTPDAEFELRRAIDEPPFLGPFKGREALRKQWFPDGAGAVDGNGRRPFGPMRHVTTNYEIDVRGETATARAFFIEIVSNGPNIPPGSRPPTIHAMGRYEDQLVKQDGQWFFSKRIVVTDLNTQWEP